jgi:secreted Zn-dependent insulinase-like peptidase
VTSAASCAALAVGVGSHHDPPELQGAFHFLEHMLFLGTEAFPDEAARVVHKAFGLENL